MGVASAAAGLSQGFPIGGSNSRTAVNDSMGARTQVAGPHRRRDGDPHPALPDRADLVPAEDRARRGDHLRGRSGWSSCRDWRALAATDRVEVAIAAACDGRRDRDRRARGHRARRRRSRSSTSSAAARGPTTRCSAGTRSSAATPTWPSTATRARRRACVVYRLDDRLFFANARYVKGRIREAINGAARGTVALARLRRRGGHARRRERARGARRARQRAARRPASGSRSPG